MNERRAHSCARAGDGAADTGTCRRANNCTGNRTGALTTAGDEQQLSAPEGVFEEIPGLEFDQAANLVAEAGRDLWTYPARADAELIPEWGFA